MLESERIKEILSALPPEQRLFRINSGTGWVGNITGRTPQAMIIQNPRALHAAPQGWPDLCGWTTKVITPDMVGQKVAIFTAVEVKVTGKLSKEQRAFRNVLTAMGGLFKEDTG